jgi:hypothetical protein
MDFAKIPFTFYDFFGYLASGFLIVMEFPLIPARLRVPQADTPLSSWILVIIAAYVLGHAISSLSKWLFELGLVGNLLKPPYENLFKKKGELKFPKFLFPEYFVPFPEYIRKKILEKKEPLIDSDNLALSDNPGTEELRGLYDKAYACAKSYKDALSRLDTFLVLYGFCRTMSLTLLILGSTFLIAGNVRTGLGGLFLSSIMFTRYLKFFRQHSYELFLSYLMPPKATPAQE